MKYRQWIIMLMLPCVNVLASPKSNVESIFATTLLLADSDAITLGFANFDPVTVFGHEIGTDESVELRNQLSVYNLPYTFILSKNQHYQDKFKLTLAYSKQTQEQVVDETFSDFNTDYVFSLGGAVQRDWFIDKHWTVGVGLANYWMTYKNDHDYSAPTQDLADLLDGSFYNIRSNSVMLQPSVVATYEQPTRWGKWSIMSHLSGFYGWTFSGSSAVRGANPSGWEWVNGVKGYFDVHADQYAMETVYMKLSRVDINGDMRPSFDTNEYYELGIGLLFDSQYFNNWIDNMGVGLNVNYGSSLSGGSLVFYLNE